MKNEKLHVSGNRTASKAYSGGTNQVEHDTTFASSTANDLINILCPVSHSQLSSSHRADLVLYLTQAMLLKRLVQDQRRFLDLNK